MEIFLVSLNFGTDLFFHPLQGDALDIYVATAKSFHMIIWFDSNAVHALRLPFKISAYFPKVECEKHSRLCLGKLLAMCRNFSTWLTPTVFKLHSGTEQQQQQ